ncbi:hypothetical protein AMTRI_Chr05g68010 [Amborella trichopoda]
MFVVILVFLVSFWYTLLAMHQNYRIIMKVAYKHVGPEERAKLSDHSGNGIQKREVQTQSYGKFAKQPRNFNG